MGLLFRFLGSKVTVTVPDKTIESPVNVVFVLSYNRHRSDTLSKKFGWLGPADKAPTQSHNGQTQRRGF